MRFLCLHGAIGNIENISIQLAPLQKELECDNSASFHYIQGPVRIKPPPGMMHPILIAVEKKGSPEFMSHQLAGFEEYFGVGPHYRWADDAGVAEDSMISRVRKIPVGQNPEDVMRDLIGDRDAEWKNRREVMNYLYETLEANPDIEGIIGYSEGASMAATLIIDEQIRLQESGRERRIKCAMFITGWPPIHPEKGIILADEVDDMIDVPSLHVVGANDPFRHGAYALYNVCDPDTAIFFDTGKGHTIPRSGLVIGELGDAVREMMSKS
ncbi:Serine hydrolase FSH [Penicillium canariense]|uniref:Serine hydrolase FSH n=1 Tax=Penicillium canariense TaxID=189055 RepID=A0A9W9I2F0_9EURO|nr:Serine hydrolase FSH [Penicillium canariense]KAJ5166626.1 Serine hydrolase FSH [Penicillium canariense]